MSTIFEKIIAGELPAERLYESERLLVIKDINPEAPVHLLLIPKKAYPSLQQLPAGEGALMEEIISVTQKLAKEQGVEEHYRLITNVGAAAGQTIFHLHFHLIGGGEHFGSLV